MIEFKIPKIEHLMNPKGEAYIISLSKNFYFDRVQGRIIDKRDNKSYPNNVDTKILIYKDRQETWFFEIADCLRLMNEAGFIILIIAISYLEGNQQFREGKDSQRRSNEFLIKAMKRVFPELNEQQIKAVIDGTRHGLFHSGMTKKGTLISCDPKEAFTKIKENIVINPHLFLDRVKKDFYAYVDLLSDENNKEGRKNFEKFWDSFWERG